MLKKCFLTILLFSGLLLSTSPMALTQPKFRLDLVQRAPSQIPLNGVATAEYLVTNQTKITRTLTTVPIQGVTQDTTFLNACSRPFTLAHGASCRLILKIEGSQISGSVNKGPVVCKTQSASNTSADPFLCSQPAQADQLSFSSTGSSGSPTISVTPASLQLLVGDGTSQHYTVTNTSGSLAAFNVQATLPAGWGDVTQDASDCTRIEPLSSCALRFTAGNTVHTAEQIPIKGTTTNTVEVSLAVLAGISIDPSSLSLEALSGTPGTIVVTNNSGVTANNIAATLPASWGDVTQDATDCVTVNPADTCNLVFTPGNATHAEETIPIQGTDTITVNATISVEPNATAKLELVGPSPLALSTTGTNVRTMTVRNRSASAAALNVAPIIAGTNLDTHVTVTGACASPLAAGNSCDIEFTAQSTAAQTVFDIEGDNTNTLLAFMAINLALGDVFDGGFVFELDANGVSGKVSTPVSPDVDGQLYQWGLTTKNVTGANSPNDGSTNTDAIVNVYGASSPYAGSVCFSTTFNINPTDTFGCNVEGGNPCVSGWYLPAICELNNSGAAAGLGCTTNSSVFTAIAATYPNNSLVWSSTQQFNGNRTTDAFGTNIGTGILEGFGKQDEAQIVCVKTFS